MASKHLVVFVLLSIVFRSDAWAGPGYKVQRGKTLTIETRFSAEVSSVQEVFLTWQTYDEANQNKKSIGQNLPGVMATAFRCKADAVVNSNSLRLSCKVPLDVVDGTYYLTSISIQTGDYEKTYSWHDEPFFVQVRIQGGEAVPDPQITSVELQ